MHTFRKLIISKKMTRFLLLCFLMRSLVASGFMVNINSNNGNLFSIMMCGGSAGINAIEKISESSQHQHHHHEHHQERDEYDYETQGHEFSACSFWSSSSQLLLVYSFHSHVRDVRLIDEVIFYQTSFLRQSSIILNLPRAPPLLS
ncbi:MAG: hypothetical protein CMF45_01425 [Legionellales bacterium]|nr:hypothetical protein [Legionellales bacterium]